MTKLIACTLLVAMTCGTQTATITGTEWKLIRMNGTDYSTLEQQVTLTVSDDAKHLSGFGGCNRYFGGVTISEKYFRVSQLGSTKMYCQETMEIEDAFLMVLQEVDAYRIEGSSLRLLAHDKVVLEFNK